MEIILPSQSLTTLAIRSNTLVILLLAGLSAHIGPLGPREARAVSGLSFGIEFEWFLIEFVLAVVAAYNGKRNAANRFAGTIPILLVCRLGADVGRLRSARSSRLGRCRNRFRCSRARIDCGGSGWTVARRFATTPVMLVPAVPFAAFVRGTRG